MKFFGYHIIITRDKTKNKARWYLKALELYRDAAKEGKGLSDILGQINNEFELRLTVKTLHNVLWRQFPNEMTEITNGIIHFRRSVSERRK